MATLIVDTNNLYYCVGRKFKKNGQVRLDYAKFVEHLESTFGDKITEKIALVVKYDDGVMGFVSYLKELGFDVHIETPTRHESRKGYYWTVDWNVWITVEAMKRSEPGDKVIIGSNSLGLLPLIKEAVVNLSQDIYITAANVPKVVRNLVSFYEITDDDLVTKEGNT